MNCKQGDLAIIVRSGAGNEGKIVRCLELIKPQTWFDNLWIRADGSTYESPRWRIDIGVPDCCGYVDDTIADCLLRPIRDPGEDAIDEMIVKLGNPKEIENA